MENFVACVSAILVIILSRERVRAETNTAWQYTCNFANGITDVAWFLNRSGLTETISRCNVKSKTCFQGTDCAVATINGLTSMSNITVSFLNKTGQVSCAEIIDTKEKQVHFDLEVHPINWTCDPSKTLRSTLQSSSEIFTTTAMSEPSTTATSKTSVTSSEVTTTITKPSTTNSESTAKLETPTTNVETSIITSETFTASSELPSTTNTVSTTSSEATTICETPTTSTETSTTSSKTSITRGQGSSTVSDTFTIISGASRTTERNIASDESSQTTSSHKPSGRKIATDLPTREISLFSSKPLTTSDQSTESIHTRDSAGGAPAGAIAGSVVGIIALCFIVVFVFVVYKRRRKRNPCPPSDQSFPAETVDVDCVNPIYETSETPSLPQAAQPSGTNCDGSQPQVTGTGPSDEVSRTPSTSTSTNEGRDKPVKPERKFL